VSSSSDNPSDEPERERGADGWVQSPADQRPYAEPGRGPDLDLDAPPDQPIARRAPESRGESPPDRATDTTVEDGKPMAVLSHMSILFGLPIFLVPIIKRDNAFALHHAKSAMVIFLLFILAFVASFATCGLAVPLALLLYVPAIVGVVHAARGERAGRWALGHWGERLLDIEVDESSERTNASPPNETTGESRPNR
jgi:hypothetical protein